jgi:alkylation response protein AidB-like acyl-CoA dehydrogenase
MRALRISNLPRGADAPIAGGASFVAYCSGSEVRAEQRRVAIVRARALHRSALSRACGSLSHGASASPIRELTDTIAGLAKLNNTRKARQICAEARDMLGGTASCSKTTSSAT